MPQNALKMPRVLNGAFLVMTSGVPRSLGAPTQEEIWSVRSGVSMTVGRLATVSLDAQYQDRSADVQDLSFDSVRVGVTTSVLF